MKIQVISSKLSTYWYHNEIGKIFEVEPCSDDNKWMLSKNNWKVFDKSDCRQKG